MKQRKSAKPNKQRSVVRQAPFTYVPPMSKRARLTWAGQIGLTESAAGSGVARVYRLNGAYDVDTGVGSTSTPGFSEYAAFFSNYRVWTASVRVVGTAYGGTTGSMGTLIMYPNATNTFLAGAGAGDAWAVAPYSVKRTVRGDSTSSNNVVTLQARYDLPSVARITRNQYKTDMDYSAASNSTPSRQIQLSVCGFAINSGNAMSFTFMVYVQMDVEFFNPIQTAS